MLGEITIFFMNETSDKKFVDVTDTSTSDDLKKLLLSQLKIS